MKKIKIMGTAVLAVVVGTSANAQTILDYTTTGVAYTQNFDSLAITGQMNPWSNFGPPTLTGWTVAGFQNTAGVFGNFGVRDSTTSAPTTYSTLRNTGLNSFGAAGSPERALGDIGSLASGSIGDFLYVLALRNTTGATMTQFTLGWDLEQWTRASNLNAHSIIFDFSDTNSTTLPTNATDASFVTGYNSPGGAFDGTTPVLTSQNLAIDGNTVGRLAGRGGTVTGLNWASGDVLVLRWWSDNQDGADHAMGLDNVTFQAVPEPGTMIALGAGVLALLKRRKKA